VNTAASRRDVSGKYNRPATLYICYGNDYRVALTTKAGQELCDGIISATDGIEVVETDHHGDVLHYAAGIRATFLHDCIDTDEAMRLCGFVVHEVKRFAKATLITLGDMGFGHHVQQVRDLEIKIVPHAQYSQAVSVSYVAKGQRTRRGFVQAYGANVVALDGWVDIEKRDAFATATSSQPGVTVQRCRDTAFGATWTTERDEAVDSAVRRGARIVADYRGYNAH